MISHGDLPLSVRLLDASHHLLQIIGEMRHALTQEGNASVSHQAFIESQLIQVDDAASRIGRFVPSTEVDAPKN